ncbi:MAG: glutathione S-transferase, partial [Pseudomonadota bacterium]|nr:glutathione S-transferase [Pseudomonadota bacterium]
IIYVTYLLANASAVQNQQAKFKTKISGHHWEQQSFPYQYKCLKSLRSELLDLDIEQKSQLTQLISGTDLGNLFTEP